jgi:hypothetical protein
MITADPPPHLTASQRRIWSFYAGQLLAEGRLPMKSRDVLAKYCLAIDVVARLNRKIRRLMAGGVKHPLLGELRAWLAISRLYESDLLLNPASAVRAPQPSPPDGDAEDRELDAILN